MKLPGPTGLPFLGHFHLFSSGLPHHIMQDLADKYGPIMMLRLGVVPVVVVSSAEIAKEVLRTQDGILASRPYFLAGEYVTYNFKDLALCPLGKHWKDMRTLCSNELFTAKRVNSFLGVRMEELSFILSRLILASGKQEIVDMKRLFSEMTFNVMARILFSKRMSGNAVSTAEFSVDGEEMLKIIEKTTELGLGFHLSEYVPPSLRWLDWTIPKAKKLGLQMDVFFQRIVDEHRESNNRETKDFTDIMLSYFEKQGCENDDIVKALLLELLPAGTDTSTTAMEWALAELIQNQHVIKLAQEEMDSVVGRDRIIEESDIPKLEYMQAIVKEALRLHPPFPLLLPHMSMEACKLAGYDIPKGATIYVNIYKIGRDPAIWENPNQFMPERFIGKSIDLKGRDFELLPFGAGRRSCPGMSSGLKTVQVTLASLLHGFNWSFPDGNSTTSMAESFGSVNWKESPLKAMAVPRLTPNPYMK